jgi:hypothetical protein
MHLAEQEVQEVGAFEPPVAEELGVVRAHHNRPPADVARDMLDLFLAVPQEVARVGGRLLHRPGPHVGLLVPEPHLARHPVVLEPQVFSNPVGEEVAKVVQGQLPTHVLVELPVVDVPRVARLRAPDLPGRFHVPGKEDDAARGGDGRVDPVSWSRVGVGETQGLEEAEADSPFGQVLLDPRVVAAFRQPDA